jgi:hypothetical protein
MQKTNPSPVGRRTLIPVENPGAYTDPNEFKKDLAEEWGFTSDKGANPEEIAEFEEAFSKAYAARDLESRFPFFSVFVHMSDILFPVERPPGVDDEEIRKAVAELAEKIRTHTEEALDLAIALPGALGNT